MENSEIKKILEDAIVYRKRDVEERQIDIDNHATALEIFDKQYANDPNMSEFRDQLSELLRTGIREQTKMKIFLEAAKVNLAKLKD